jgi:hypothetical protein
MPRRPRIEVDNGIFHVASRAVDSVFAAEASYAATISADSSPLDDLPYKLAETAGV